MTQEGNKQQHDSPFAPEPAKKSSKFDPKAYKKAKAKKATEAIEGGNVKQTTCAVKKPGKFAWFSVHPSEEYHLDATVIVDETTRDTYLVDADLDLPPELENKTSSMHLALAVDVDGNYFLLAFKNGENMWAESMRVVTREAQKGFIRMVANMAANGYTIEYPFTDPPQPRFPKMTFEEILEQAFSTRHIDDLDHPIVRRLRGIF